VDLDHGLRLNAEMATQRPDFTLKAAPRDASEFKGVAGTFALYLSPAPCAGS
jgi:hypothetical protein